MLNNFMKDPLANGQAVIVLIALLISCICSLLLFIRDIPIPKGKSWYTGLLPVFTFLGILPALDLLQTSGWALAMAGVVSIVLVLNILMPLLLLTEKSTHPIVKNWYTWAIPILVIGGFAVSGFLAFIQPIDSKPVCGPIGDCSAVQNSRYAVLFDFLPIGLLGFIGYVVILIAWIVGQLAPGLVKKWSILIVWGLCIFGVIFSAYLTYLEPFVIGATCMWCVSSAVLMTLLLWVSTPAAHQALLADIEDD
jgi:uncharacterized membrane protein